MKYFPHFMAVFAMAQLVVACDNYSARNNQTTQDITLKALDSSTPLQEPVEENKIKPEDKAFNTENYDQITENKFLSAMQQPLSTFSIDVDRASYSNVRRFIEGGALPPKGAVRIEEMINYFDYNYQQPSNDDPFAIHTEIASCPWNTKHKLI